MTLLDPCNPKLSLETLVKTVDHMRNQWRNIFNKSADKQAYSVLPITHVLEAGKIPAYHQLGEDEFGNFN